jgi:hypothetical protein
VTDQVEIFSLTKLVELWTWWTEFGTRNDFRNIVAFYGKNWDDVEMSGLCTCVTALSDDLMDILYCLTVLSDTACLRRSL